MIEELQRETRSLQDRERARHSLKFFKTGKGGYGEGDKFYGLTNPICHKLAKKYKDLTLAEIQILIKSKIHEERLIALLILVKNFNKNKTKIYNLYLKNTKYINNWDLVDLSAHKIVGAYLCEGQTFTLLEKLAKSKNLWKRRIAIISTFAFLGKIDSKPSLEIAEILVNDKEDLIHKAVGWTLREVGKRVSLKDERKFLDRHIKHMPRTMLRYAIERFPEKLRLKYLNYGKEIKQRATSGD